MKLALKLEIQTYQILTNDDEVCIPSLSSILLAVIYVFFRQTPCPKRPNQWYIYAYKIKWMYNYISLQNHNQKSTW